MRVVRCIVAVTWALACKSPNRRRHWLVRMAASTTSLVTIPISPQLLPSSQLSPKSSIVTEGLAHLLFNSARSLKEHSTKGLLTIRKHPVRTIHGHFPPLTSWPPFVFPSHPTVHVNDVLGLSSCVFFLGSQFPCVASRQATPRSFSAISRPCAATGAAPTPPHRKHGPRPPESACIIGAG